jgi:protein-disulfide isomerase
MRARFLIFGLGAFAASLCVVSAAGDNEVRLPKDMVLVEVGGTKITYADLQKKKAGMLFAADTNRYEAERRALDEFIDDVLLDRQAAEEGLTVEQLLDKHVKSALPKDPSEEALHVYYEGVDTTEPYEAIRPKILAGLQDRRMKKAKAAYLQSLRQQVPIVLRLPPPRMPIALAGVPIRGLRNAPVVLTEYADFECPVCQQVQPIVAKIEKEFEGKLAFAYKDFPLPMHPNAEKAAEGSHCADVQGQYWKFHDLVLEKGRTEVAALKGFSRDLKLDTEAFEKCLDSGAEAELVKKSLDEANLMGLNGTPSFFVNGRYVSGNVTLEKLRAIINEELSAVENQRENQRGLLGQGPGENLP